MWLSEFNKLKNYLKPGDICAIKYRVPVKYTNRYTGKDYFKTEVKEEILEFKHFSGDYMQFENDLRIYHVNLSYLKKIQCKTTQKISA